MTVVHAGPCLSCTFQINQYRPTQIITDGETLKLQNALLSFDDEGSGQWGGVGEGYTESDDLHILPPTVADCMQRARAAQSFGETQQGTRKERYG